MEIFYLKELRKIARRTRFTNSSLPLRRCICPVRQARQSILRQPS